MTEIPAPPLHRMYLKTEGDRAEVERACLEGGFLGLGYGYRWDKRSEPRSVTWDRYIAWAEKNWPGQMGNVRRLRDADGLVWTRTADGVYYLAEFVGDWEYRKGDPYDELDLNNVRPARIEEIGGETSVPGAIVRRFSRQGQAICAVHDESAARYSALVWAKKTRTKYAWSPSIDEVLDTLLSPFDVQDLVAAYLQAERGWLLFPSRLSDGTPAYEYVMRDPGNGNNHAIQVKTGDAPIYLPDLAQASDLKSWVIFSTTEAYQGKQTRRVEKLGRDELIRFMQERQSALPPVVETWLKVVK